MQVCPSLLVKKDRGRPIDPKARPKAYGEVNVVTDVPGAELLHIVDNDDEQESSDSDDSIGSGSDNDQENDLMSINDDEAGENQSDNTGSDDDEANKNDVGSEDEDEINSDCKTGVRDADDDDVEDMGDDLEVSEQADEEDGEVSEHEEDDDLQSSSDDESVGTKSRKKDSAKKRKFTDFNGQLIAADTSLRALKKLAGTTVGQALPESTDGILSNEDFQRIKELKVSSFLNQ